MTNVTDIVKITVDGEEHWTVERSPAHEKLLARQADAEQQQDGTAGHEGGQTEEGDGADQQKPEVHRDGDDHDTAGAGGEPGDRAGDDGGTARSGRRTREAQSASGS